MQEEPRFQPDPQTGLTAAQVQARVEQGAVNTQENATSKSYKAIVTSNLFTFFNLINAILATLIILVGSFKNLLFLFVIVANTLIGILQEIRAKKTLDKLSLMVESKANAVRDGKAIPIPVDEVVLDDILLFAAGNQICADAILRQGRLEVNEALISGESETVVKKPGDSLYSGSFVVSGKGLAQVEHVGKQNFANKIIAQAKVMKKQKSQLRDSINVILKFVSIIIVPLGAVLFAKQYLLTQSFRDSVVNTVAAVLGMIPEGLVLLTSVALAVGAIHLARKKTLVHELFCIETLARVDVLCLDKTGTITEGRMEVEEVIPLDDTDVGLVMGNLVRALNDDNATFCALRERFGTQEGFTATQVIPFSSERKYSGACFAEQGTYIMGAFEFMFQGQYPEIKEKVDGYAAAGVRTLVLAHSETPPPGETSLPENLAPCAVILITDLLRKDAKETLQYFSAQGVDLFVISGDNPVTVSNIAQKAGLRHAEAYVDASTLSSKEALLEAVRKYHVFGRVTPSQKKEIVLALKEAGHTVAMTGDGVNDVPALKEADCSIAMAQGSDAAKDSANLVLLDSNFSSMPHIVNEGRRVINNIQKAASLFLVKTIFSIVLSLITLFIPHSYPFMPLHLSLISVWAVGIPTFLLTLEPNFKRVRGNFLRNVLKVAFPGAATIIIEILLITAWTSLFGLTPEVRSTLCVITTGMMSLFILRDVYDTFTPLRQCIFYTMSFAFLASMAILQPLMSLVTLDFASLVFLLALISLVPSLLKKLYHGVNIIAHRVKWKWKKLRQRKAKKKKEKQTKQNWL